MTEPPDTTPPAGQPPLPPADAALAAALTRPLPGEGAEGRLLTIDELAGHSGLPTSVLEAMEREGLLIPRVIGDAHRYTTADADALRAGLALVEAGLPLDELFSLARDHTAQMRDVARNAVELFLRYVRDPIRSGTASEEEATARLLEAFQTMLPATTVLVGHHFGRLLVNAAHERLEERR